jgi:pimeloyl-ACP methyl ester carboxylesterase
MVSRLVLEELAMPASTPLPVVFMPGGVTPVGLSYAPLLRELEPTIEPLLKDLEVYTEEEPPANYSVQLEVDGLERVVNSAGLETFHLVSYSGGGAISLAFAAQHPDRLRSLAMFEPANVPGPWDPADHPEVAGLATLAPDALLSEFTRRQLRPGVEPPAPPPSPAPDWMARRPAGLRAMTRAFETDATDREGLRRCSFPVYLAYGLLTAEAMVRRVQLLAGLLPDVWIEAYPGLHHFSPPQRTQPVRYATALRALWARAEGVRSGSTGEGDAGYAA